jgi:hypothetical protein
MNFVHGHPYVSISLGLSYMKRPVVGVVYNPFYHHLYTGAVGSGAFFEDFRGRRQLPMRNSTTPLKALGACLILVEWGKERGGVDFETTVETFKNLSRKEGGFVHDLRTFGSAALNLCTVATGAVDLCWGGGWDAWDVCAGWAILLEAGGKMVDGNPSASLDEPPLGGKRFLAGKTPKFCMYCAYGCGRPELILTGLLQCVEPPLARRISFESSGNRLAAQEEDGPIRRVESGLRGSKSWTERGGWGCQCTRVCGGYRGGYRLSRPRL